MSKVKITVKTDEFEVELPCLMEVRDQLSEDWLNQIICCFDHTNCYPWRTECGEGYRYARPIPKPKMIPWEFEEIKNHFLKNGIVKPSDGNVDVLTRIQGLDLETESVWVDDSDSWINVRVFNRTYVDSDGNPFEKEVK